MTICYRSSKTIGIRCSEGSVCYFSVADAKTILRELPPIIAEIEAFERKEAEDMIANGQAILNRLKGANK